MYQTEPFSAQTGIAFKTVRRGDLSRAEVASKLLRLAITVNKFALVVRLRFNPGIHFIKSSIPASDQFPITKF